MKCKVIWHDAEDDCTGTSFEIEGKDLKECYHNAEDHIKGISQRLSELYWGLDIECLIDEQGNYHNPDFFLDDVAVAKYEQFCKDMKIKHEFKYDPSMGLYHPSSELETIANDPAHICTRIPDEEGKKEIEAQGYLKIGSKTEWHTITYLIFNGDLLLGRGENWPSSSSRPHLVTTSLMNMRDFAKFELSRGANITHILRHEFRRDKDFKEYSHITDVYQFEPDGKTLFENGRSR